MAPSDVNNVARQQMADHRYQWEDAEWLCWGDTVSKASATTFKIASDVTSRYLVDRRVKIFDTTTKYATIHSASYSAPDTTIALTFDDDKSLGASFTAVALAILSPTNMSAPKNLLRSTPNVIIGGNFDTNPWQRGTTFTSTANNAFTADRFRWLNVGAGVVDVKKTADAPTLAQCGMTVSNCLHVDVTTADASLAASDQYELRYIVEGYDFAHIFGKPFTLSFWHKHTKTGTQQVAFYNSAFNQYYIASYTQDVTDTWEFASITVPAYATGTWLLTNGSGLGITFPLAMGSDRNAGVSATWTAATGQLATTSLVNNMDNVANNFKLALIKLEPGSYATPYPFESEADVLKRCERYYEKTYDQGTNPGTNTRNGEITFVVKPTDTAAAGINCHFRTTKRTAPTVTPYDQAGTSAVVTLINNGNGFTPVVNGTGANSVAYQTTAATSNAGMAFHTTADAELSI